MCNISVPKKVNSTQKKFILLTLSFTFRERLYLLVIPLKVNYVTLAKTLILCINNWKISLPSFLKAEIEMSYAIGCSTNLFFCLKVQKTYSVETLLGLQNKL